MQAVKKFDSGDEEGCKRFTMISMILCLTGIPVAVIPIILISVIFNTNAA